MNPYLNISPEPEYMISLQDRLLKYCYHPHPYIRSLARKKLYELCQWNREDHASSFFPAIF